MPAPFTIVTLTDDDGDEFPIRVSGSGNDRALEQRARIIAQYLIDEGSIAPTGVLRVANITVAAVPS